MNIFLSYSSRNYDEACEGYYDIATDGIGVRPMIKVNISSGMLKKVLEES